MAQARLGFEWLLVALVLLAAVPMLVANFQFLLIGLHFRKLHYAQCRPYFPRTAILVPAWNEAAVVGASIDRLMLLDFPRESLRIFVVDDASTDATPEVIQAKAAQYPGSIVHLRRDKGGEGKAATLNHGLAVILADDWMQAILIMDADVIYVPSALRRMTQHLADPGVGSVTAYIKEGSQPANWLARFIGYEYITAQAAARRSQVVLGVIACLAGGAQLHSRENIEALGGRIDTATLAEDTVTTFETQLAGRRAIFEPHATVWSEEPAGIASLWKQRLRWARGNVQVTRRYRDIWFRPQPGNALGSIRFGMMWFSILLLPILMVMASGSLVTLYFIDYSLGGTTFHTLWLAGAITYLFITFFALLIDPAAGRRTWKEAVLFPGAVNLIILMTTILPGLASWLGHQMMLGAGFAVTPGWLRGIQLFLYIWLAACMGVAYFGKVCESRPLGRILGPVLVYIGGYGPLLCAVTMAAYLKEFQHAEMRWDKTEKTGKVAAPA
jgi:cellulose synthase/poly-beta-1,6-N-acetylglucosamine synthase-like glycosyltransferase